MKKMLLYVGLVAGVFGAYKLMASDGSVASETIETMTIMVTPDQHRAVLDLIDTKFIIVSDDNGTISLKERE